MALSGTEYKENGVVKDRALGGALSVTVYDGAQASTYYKQNGLLLDADGRVVVSAA